jgi:hypothetical protein
MSRFPMFSISEFRLVGAFFAASLAAFSASLAAFYSSFLFFSASFSASFFASASALA